jgi:hypothetical protein
MIIQVPAELFSTHFSFIFKTGKILVEVLAFLYLINIPSPQLIMLGGRQLEYLYFRGQAKI